MVVHRHTVKAHTFPCLPLMRICFSRQNKAISLALSLAFSSSSSRRQHFYFKSAVSISERGGCKERRRTYFLQAHLIRRIDSEEEERERDISAFFGFGSVRKLYIWYVVFSMMSRRYAKDKREIKSEPRYVGSTPCSFSLSLSLSSN